MSEKCGEYDKAMTYLIWVCCASRKGKLDFMITIVLLFNDLLPFNAGDPTRFLRCLSLQRSSLLAPTTLHGDLQWRLGRNARGGER